MASLGLGLHVVLELVPLATLTLANRAGFMLDLISEFLDFTMEAFPGGLATHTNRAAY